METEIYWRWSKEKVRARQRLISWFEGLPLGTEVQITGLKESVPVGNILVWLGGLTQREDYNEVERGVLNDLLRIRKEWANGN